MPDTAVGQRCPTVFFTVMRQPGGDFSSHLKLLKKADEKWRALVASSEPVERSPEFLFELDRISAAAEKELLS